MLLELTKEELAALKAARALGQRLNLAEQARQLAAGIQRDILATVDQCQAQLAAGAHPAVVADYARRQGRAMAAVVDKINASNVAAVAEAVAVLGYTPDQVAILHRYLAAGVARLGQSAADGSTVADDLAEVGNAFTRPVQLW